MVRHVVAFVAVFVMLIAVGTSAFAQSAPSVFAPAPFKDKAAEKEQIKQRMSAQKWAGCKRQARARKIKFMHRNKFMNDCMAS
jgi:hypothetical protein